MKTQTVRVDRPCEPARLSMEVMDAVAAAGGSRDIGVVFRACHADGPQSPKGSLAMYAVIIVPEPLFPYMVVITGACAAHTEARVPAAPASKNGKEADLAMLEKCADPYKEIV